MDTTSSDGLQRVLRGDVAVSTRRQKGGGGVRWPVQAQLWAQSGRGRTCPHVTTMGDQWLGSVRGGPPSRGRSVENFLSPGPRSGQGGLYGGGHAPGAFYPPGWGGHALSGDYGIASLDIGPGHARKGIERSKSFSQGDEGEIIGQR